VTGDLEWHTVERLADLRAIVEQLQNAPCWKFAFSYGDELYLDLGSQRTFESGPMKGEAYGEWEVFARASPWSVRSSDGRRAVSSTDERSQAEPLLGDLATSRVTGVAVSEADLSLSLDFANGLRFVISCGDDDSVETGTDADEEIACWELITPAAYCAEAWPGRRWRLVPYERT
jgi:hypothetical protein